jgi:hypothetical protein
MNGAAPLYQAFFSMLEERREELMSDVFELLTSLGCAHVCVCACVRVFVHDGRLARQQASIGHAASMSIIYVSLYAAELCSKAGWPNEW